MKSKWLKTTIRGRRALADVSWLLPLCYGGHEHHEVARAWLEVMPEGDQVAVCRLAQMGLLRYLTLDQGFRKFRRVKLLILPPK